MAPPLRAQAAAQQNWQRAGGATLVLLLHMLVLLAALRAITAPGIAPRREQELTFVLPTLRKLPPKTAIMPQTAPSPRAITLPPPPALPPPASPAAPDVRSLGRSLFGCAPENLGNLPSEQRARCSGIAPSDGMAVIAPRSHVKDPELRAAEMEKKNTPMTVPCVTIQTQSLGPAYQQHILMVDPVCAEQQLRN
ncbi:MAG TPA: hypothetical protein VHZ32_05200 [Rhizomicrobium sp.]|nr:hypothetical protein [Rhizomicrobium sp.]